VAHTCWHVGLPPLLLLEGLLQERSAGPGACRVTAGLPSLLKLESVVVFDPLLSHGSQSISSRVMLLLAEHAEPEGTPAS
jgi:hypothetical protein